MQKAKAGMSQTGKGVSDVFSDTTIGNLAKAGGRAAAHNNPVSQGYKSGYKMAIGQDGSNSRTSESGGGSNGQNARGNEGNGGSGESSLWPDQAAKYNDFVDNQNPYNK